MNRMVLRTCALLLVILFAMSASAQRDPNYDIPPPPDEGGGSGSSCSYCSQARCGCASAPLGYVLYYSCTCSSGTCSHSCSYEPR